MWVSQVSVDVNKMSAITALICDYLKLKQIMIDPSRYCDVYQFGVSS